MADVRAGGWVAWQELVSSMKADGLKPTVATHCCLLRGYGRTSNIGMVRATLENMQADIADAADDAFVLATVADALVSCGRTSEALQLVRRAERETPHLLSAHAYGALAKGLSRDGRHGECLEVAIWDSGCGGGCEGGGFRVEEVEVPLPSLSP